MQPNQRSENDGIDQILKELFELARENPILKPILEKNKQMIMDTMKDLIKQQRPDLTRRDLSDKNLFNQLHAALIATAALCQTPLVKSKELLEKLKKIFTKDKRFDLRINPEKTVKETLTPEEIKQLRQDTRDGMDKVFDLLKKCGFKLPEPKPGKKLSEEVGIDKYSNLFSVISSTVTSGLASVVSCFMGNGVGFTDWSPNVGGTSPISSQNNPDDSKANLQAVKRMVSLGSDETKKYQEELGNFSKSTTPKLKMDQDKKTKT